ncbi:DUF1707 domain-containing protein [Amycolatopsis sp. YIM 10]|uniref:DUF1707 domain-containing protein n=1 Tax=Amycolatopsis sp. YIM 10 TaxID=2653857 RepID=UPI00129014D2|nr:DUF1707 domain-containing protein [Amycolatopsis sp. YIM 10]
MTTSPDPDAVRIGTFEREQCVKALGDHFAEGRLETDEYEQRVTAALGAQTKAELAPLFADLPEPHPPVLRPPGPPPVPAYGQFPQPVYGYTPAARGLSDKSKLTTGLLQILLPFGIGRFYSGHVGIGLAQLLVVLVTCGAGVLWPIIDGIVILANGGYDAQGRRLLD